MATQRLVLLLAGLLVGLLAPASAQERPQSPASLAKTAPGTQPPRHHPLRGVMMKGGRVMLMYHGESKPMDKHMDLSDMKVSPDGTVMRRDGTSWMLKDGEAMMTDGLMGVMMQDGRMMTLWPGGKTRVMKTAVTLMDGTRVMRDGKVLMKDGTSLTVSNGDLLTADGTFKKAEPPQ